MESVISIKNLNKVYEGGFQALKDVNLEIKKGEIFGLLGPNGAGKTTLINILVGLVKRTSGEAKVFGEDVDDNPAFTKPKIGVVQQEINADTFFTVEETVAFQAGYYGMADPNDRVVEVLEELNLTDKAKTTTGKLSGGMKRRVMIAKAMVHNPDILFLDEPTAGVDVELRENLWRIVKKLQSLGKTIILTTHYLEEAEELADRIGIINNGEIVMVENKRDLLERHDKKLSDIYKDLIGKHNKATKDK